MLRECKKVTKLILVNLPDNSKVYGKLAIVEDQAKKGCLQGITFIIWKTRLPVLTFAVKR